MKKSASSPINVSFIIVAIFLFISFNAMGQDTTNVSAPLPDKINKIVSASCMPCHSSSGGMLSRGKLNFTEWSNYSPEKQKKKAEEIYVEVKKNKMPPKSAIENNPDIIPTREQKETIKSWVDSFVDEGN